jgi:hypothetical protein
MRKSLKLFGFILCMVLGTNTVVLWNGITSSNRRVAHSFVRSIKVSAAAPSNITSSPSDQLANSKHCCGCHFSHSLSFESLVYSIFHSISVLRPLLSGHSISHWAVFLSREKLPPRNNFALV